MAYIYLYITTLIAFLVIDFFGLKFILGPLFSKHLGDQMVDSLRYGPVVAFYLFYVVGLVYFVGGPALKDGNTHMAFVNGAFIGALAYGSYEFTNYATLKVWNMQMLIPDLVWGTVITGVAAWIGVVVTRALIA